MKFTHQTYHRGTTGHHADKPESCKIRMPGSGMNSTKWKPAIQVRSMSIRMVCSLMFQDAKRLPITSRAKQTVNQGKSLVICQKSA